MYFSREYLEPQFKRKQTRDMHLGVKFHVEYDRTCFDEFKIYSFSKVLHLKNVSNSTIFKKNNIL